MPNPSRLGRVEARKTKALCRETSVGIRASRSNLAAALLSAGRYSDAAALNAAVLKAREARLGPDHPDTLISRNNLAVAYLADGRHAEAAALHAAVLKAREARLGADHPDTLRSRHGLAAAYQYAGRYTDAAALHEAVLKAREARLGADHPDTLTSRDGLAAARLAAGHHAEALRLFEAVLKAREAKLGPDHSDTLASRNNLALAYEALGRWSDAESSRRDTLARRRRRESPDSPLLAGDLAGLGHNLLRQARGAEAAPLLREGLAIFEKSVPHEWRRFDAMSLSGAALTAQGKHATAEPLVVGGYEGMQARAARIPASGRSRLSEAAERVVRLYEAWGRREQARAWAERLGLADLPADVFARP
jgi:non-specific serine/threonine protein kinase/serine/threonine-protein kinase